MSKDLIVRLREAAARRVASTAMIGAEDLSAAADALELATAGINAYSDELGRCRAGAGFGSADDPMAQEGFDAFGDPLCVAAFVESQFKRVVAERDALAAKLKAVRGDQSPTVEDINLQEWKGMDGACAWHLIDRHADDWNHIARLMNAWLEANREELAAELKALREQEPVSHEFQAQDGSWRGFINESHYKNTVEDGSWPIRALYAHPVPARELTDAVDKRAQHIRQIDGNHTMGAGALAESIAEWADRHLKGDGE